MPKIAIVDPIFSLQMPKSVTVATGLDALTHGIEAYTSRKAFAESDIFALSAIRRIFKFLPIVIRDEGNQQAREEMAIAAFEAGISISNSSVTIVHGMSRPIGALFHVPHGISNAMLLKECLLAVFDGAFERFGRLGREIGVAETEETDEIAASRFIQAVSELCHDCEVPSLEEYGINQEMFFHHCDKMATDAIASGSPSNTRKSVEKEDIINIYHNLWK